MNATLKGKMLFAILGVVCGMLAGLSVRAENYAANTTIAGEMLTLGSGEVLAFDVNAGVTVTVTRVISGEGVIRKTGTGVLLLAGANTHTGGVELVTGELWANAAGAFGTGPVLFTGPAVTGNTVPSLLAFNAPDATFANDIWFKVVPKNLGNKRGSIEFRANTRLTGNIYGPGSLYNWIDIGVVWIDGLAHDKNATVVFDGDILFTGTTYGLLRINAYGTQIFNGKVMVSRLDVLQAWSSSGNLYFNNPDTQMTSTDCLLRSYCPWIVFGVDNILTNIDVEAQYAYSAEKLNGMDLNGHNQSFRALRVNPVDNPGYPVPAAPNDGRKLQLTSSLPATLTLTGLGAGKTTDTYHAFNGALSLVLDANPAYTLNLTNRTHYMSGALIVSNGTLRATAGTSFRNAQRVCVAAGATLDVNTSAANAFGACAALDVDGTFTFTSTAVQGLNHPDVTLGASAQLALPEGATTFTVKSLTVNGEAKAEGFYTHDEIPQLTRGRIRVVGQAWPDLVEPVYTLTVPAQATDNLDDISVDVTQGGETTTLSFSALTALPTTGTIRKVGAGVLRSSTSLSGFTGQILVEEGGFSVDGNLQAGPQDVSTAPVVWVKSGASFILAVTADKCPGNFDFMLKNSFHFSGNGLNGLGALDVELGNSQRYSFRSCGTWYLEGDARIGGYSTQMFDLYNTTLDMKGHQLELKRPAGRTAYFTLFLDQLTIQHPGGIVVDGAKLSPQGKCWWPADAASTITFINGGCLGYWNSLMQTTQATTLNFPSVTVWSIGGSSGDSNRVTPGAITQGYWDGPVQVNGALRIDCTTAQKGAALRGKLSGAGSLLLCEGWLHLSNSDNDFTGSVGVTASGKVGYEQGLALYANGALPLTCREVAVTNAEVRLLEATRFDLPTIACVVPSGTNLPFAATSAVREGTLAGLVKKGVGTLDYTAPLAVTGTLDVAEGMLNLAGQSLAVGTLALGGGTVKGDLAVAHGLAFASTSVAGGALKMLTVNGAVSFADGATLDLDELVEGGVTLASRYGEFPILRATGGITGTLGISAVAQGARWRCVLSGDTVYAARHAGTQILFR